MRDAFDAYMRATNTYDKEALVEPLADEFILTFTETGARMTQQDLAFISDFDAAVKAHARVENVRFAADTLVADIAVVSDLLYLAGVDEQRVTLRCTFAHGKIRRILYETPPGETSWVAALAPVVEWAQQTDPAALDGIYVDGAVVFSYDSGIRWVELLTRWRTATGQG